MRVAVLVALTMLVGCSSSSGLSGKYLVPGTQTYGFDFQGDTVYSMTGDQVARGTYTVDGSTVRICISFLCTDLRLDGSCLVQGDASRYCRE